MKIFVLFVEPMLYGMDLIREVYEKTEYEYQYVYCTSKLTGRDEICLPENAFVCFGTNNERKKQIISLLESFNPDLAVINGYVGIEQTTAIRYCQKNSVPYSIESDTPLHIPENKIKAIAKKIYLRTLLHNSCCYGFPGGTLQKENLMYYGIPESKCKIMPMSVSSERMIKEKENLPSKDSLKDEYGVRDKKVFLFVGRLEKVKNVTLIIRAFERLKEKHKNIALMIVGDGSESQELKRMIKTRGISDVYFAGYVVFPDIIKYYKMSDVFVLPSSYEPWGLVVNEAMIMDLPVIVSSAVGCRVDLIKDEQNGFIFADNQESELLSKMENALNFKIKCKTIDKWNYVQYLINFRNAVETIC